MNDREIMMKTNYKEMKGKPHFRGELLTTLLPKVALASINLKFNLLAVATSGFHCVNHCVVKYVILGGFFTDTINICNPF